MATICQRVIPAAEIPPSTRDVLTTQEWLVQAQLQDDSEARVQLAEERNRELVGKLADLMEQRFCMEKEKGRLIEDLDQLKGKLDDRERELAEANQKLRAMLVTSASSDASIKLLEESDALRNKISGLEAQLKEASQEKERKAQLTAKVQELEANSCTPGSPTPGSVTEPKVNALQKKVGNLQEQLRDKEKQVGKLKERVKSLQVDTSNKDTALSTLEESLAEKERDIERMKKKMKTMEADAMQYQEDLAAAERTRKQAQTERDELQEEMNSFNTKLSRAADEKRRQDARVDQLEEELEFEEQFPVEKSQVDSQEAKVRELETKLEWEKTQAKRMKSLVTRLMETLEKRRRENKDLQVQLERETTRCGQLGTTNAKLNQRLASKQHVGRSEQHVGRSEQHLGRSHQRLERSHQRLERSHQRLERSHQQLEDLLAEMRRRAQETGPAGPCQA
ncbi:unnamed protein product, partial [Lota lota]